MFPEESRQIYMHLTEVLRYLEIVRADYPEQGWMLSHLHDDVKTTRNRINEMLS
jgi:hypothetical protein